MATKGKFRVISFFRFLKIKNKKETKKSFDNFLKDMSIRGTILVSSEGINGSLSGTKKDLESTLKFIRKLLMIRELNLKINEIDYLPFNRLKVRIKKEIVTLGKGFININKLRGKLVSPNEWDKVISDKNIKLIDVRNIYEINIGRFKGAINPKTNSFRDFPNIINKLRIKKSDKIAMYCTGGIRCEKASSFLKSNGYNNVHQLKGGIINYLEYTSKKKKKSLWEGECFVFDERVAINKDLKKGSYKQCYGCRSPITKKDINSIHYSKGIHCPYCYNKRSKKQIERSRTRQNQINNAIKKKQESTFIKITEKSSL
tara:strand:+ start:28 stop:972 length:945 start_codon:yes stop_codon:yes gene_type:complete